MKKEYFYFYNGVVVDINNNDTVLREIDGSICLPFKLDNNSRIKGLRAAIIEQVKEKYNWRGNINVEVILRNLTFLHEIEVEE